MKTFNDSPNFSIVMPGACNAKCAFCFNKGTDKVKKAPLNQWIKNLDETLRGLGNQFYQISITGGEPLLSPYFDPLMVMLIPAKEKYTNILLTTNGTNLLDKIESVSTAVDHINISRHHWDEAKNNDIFGGSYKTTDFELLEIIDEYGKRGIDISVNCVIDDSTDHQFILDYIDWAKEMGVEAIRFRKQNGILDPTPVEKLFSDYKVVWHGDCPVCRTDLQMIRGQKVYWKSSTIEPTETIKDSIFELVYQPDGAKYADWAMEKPIINLPVEETISENIAIMFERNWQKIKEQGDLIEPRHSRIPCGGRSSCGGSGGGRCGGGSSSRC